MEDKVMISAGEIEDLARLTREINDRVESLELMNDKSFMASFKKSKQQIKNRDFSDWNAL
jgi:hypothetical protein